MSRNYKEDQHNEVEALESIYCGEMEIIENEPYYKISIPIATEEFSNEDLNGLSCNLIFKYTPKYPDEAPIVQIEDTINFAENFEERLLEHIKEIIDENIGMEMIFSLVSSAQEWLNIKYDEYKNEKENENARKQYELEEAERKKFEGTRVNVETFMKWKTEFENELGISARREKIYGDGKKLTGREMFITDKTLNDSDIKFLLAAGDALENVKIDESLFQNLDDLDLDSEDDEDYVPGKDID